MSDLIAYHLEDGIATLTLSNGKVNAISPDVITAFNAALDQAESNFDAAQLQVENATLNVSLSRSGVVDLVTRSPVDAIVTARLKEPGETVTMAPATVVLELLLSAVAEPRGGPSPGLLMVLRPERSELVLEAVRGGRKVSRMEFQPWDGTGSHLSRARGI